MPAKRVIAWLDVKPPRLVKGIQMEGLRTIGDPAEFARRYYADGADELIYVDINASLDGRNGLESLVRSSSEGCFIPLTAGGGIRTIDDVRRMIDAGADKVVVNTGVIRRPELITEVARTFGSQCISISIEYMGGLCFTDCGREHTGINAFDWARRAVDLGAGELVLTSIAHEGLRHGLDCDFIGRVAQAVGVPVVGHGGTGCAAHIRDAFEAGASGVAVASILHHGKTTISDLKKGLHGYPVRAA